MKKECNHNPAPKQNRECKLDKRNELVPIILPVADKGPQSVANNPIDTLDLGGSLVVMWGAKDETSPQAIVKRSPKLGHEKRVAI